ncbi:hypothetical protein [Flavobacterium sp. IMCC34518]|uniref:hypothetical protein n=1 Tax=Flavobacterium sp. IMCC34518 TaxID=3003623 RepID=UPI0022AC8BEE|nr:hypothetical protein [Flavobacterium sp. IMCC34518]
MIKIYTDKTFINQDYRKIIFPLLFDLCYAMNKTLLKKYTIVDTIHESDVVIVPVEIGYFYTVRKQKWLYDFIDDANKLRKNVWVYTAGDFGITLIKDVYTFRLGGFESKFDAKTFILPAFISDPYLEMEKKFIPVIKSKHPKIGFVGHANGSFFKWGKEFLIYGYYNLQRISRKIFSDYQSFYPSSIRRFNFLMALKKNSLIETDFILRDKYRAGVSNELERKQTTKAFFDNIYDNPYTFCLRGAGNFSVRLYETLAMGRIPLVIDTDFRLPLNHKIIWNNHCVIVSENNYMAELIDFHKTITDDEFIQMQINNRSLWLNHLNREAYFAEIHSVFKELV